MFTKLSVQNFKAWEDTGELKLAPLTIFFGANSSGKSSIGQFLLMLKRTAQSADRNLALDFGSDEHDVVDLGSYTDLIHAHESDRDLTFELSWEPPSPLTIANPLAKAERYTGSEVRFRSTVSLPVGTERPACTSFEYALWHEGLGRMFAGMREEEEGTGRYIFESACYDFKRRRGRPYRLSPDKFYGFPDELNAQYENAGVLSDLELSMKRQLDRLFYLGPLRDTPHRTYRWPGQSPEHVGYLGEYTVAAYLSAADRQLSPCFRKRNKSFGEVVASWLKQMGLVNDFKVQEVSKNQGIYEVLLQRAPSDEWVKLPDVGFGVSQVLPVLVQCMYVPHHATIFMEQPEIHLHPSVQMELADLFIETIHSREDYRGRNTQLLIESHSEWFLRRLQRRIAEQALSEDEVAIYFCTSRAGKATIERLDHDMFGNISNWPDNFFGDQMEDISRQRLAAIRRRKAQ